MFPYRIIAGLGLCVCLGSGVAVAQAPDESDAAVMTWRYSFKNSALFSRLPDDPLLFPDRTGAAGLWRFRVEPYVRLDDRNAFEIAFEQRVRTFSSTFGSVGADVLPADAPAPFRIR